MPAQGLPTALRRMTAAADLEGLLQNPTRIDGVRLMYLVLPGFHIQRSGGKRTTTFTDDVLQP